ncbi:MAG TPA: serine hydrolase [Ktedonobacter sp.]|nr:serine hydrolase [Ktedonobacter sp.]
MQTSEQGTAQQANIPQLQSFDDFVRTTMQEWKLPGLAIAIVKDGNILFSQGFGKRNIAQDLDVTPKTLFAIGSCTKAFTATAMGILVDEGKLDWDTPVRNYLPSFKMHDTVATERMTSRDLLTHRSGLPRHDLAWYNSSRSRKEMFDSLQYLEPTKDFRTFWQYQNLMYMTAGYLVGEIAGTSWEEFVQQRILTPLGMTTSTYTIAGMRQTDDNALPYKEVKDEVQETHYYEAFDAVAPAGAINSSVEEMCAWLLLQMNKGKHGNTQIVSEAQLAQIHTPYMVIPDPKRYTELSYVNYALGWMVYAYKGNTVVQHSGGIDGFSALTTFLPDDKLGIVVLTNMGSCPVHTIITNNAIERLLGLEQGDWNTRVKKQVEETKEVLAKAKEQHLSDRISDTHPSHKLDAYTGEFENPGYGKLSVEQVNGRLQVTYNTFTRALTHYHYDIFEAELEDFELITKVAFTTNLKGDIASLAMKLEPTANDIVFERVPRKEMMEKSFLEPFVGQYELLGITVTVSLHGDTALFLSVPGQPEYELVPYQGTTFQFKGLSGFSVEFKQDASGDVSEAVLTQPQGVMAAKKKAS